MTNLKNGLVALGMVVVCYVVATLIVCYVAPWSALADSLTGPLTLQGNLTVAGNIHSTLDGDFDNNLNVDGDTVIDGSCDMNTALADTFKAASGTSFNVRAADGQDDAVLDTYQLTVDGTSTLTGVVTATAGVVGDLTGSVTTEVALKGNLPSAKSAIGVLDGRLYRNAAGDSGWMATDADSTWIQMWP